MAVAGGSSFEHAQTGRTLSREEQTWLDGFERTAGSEDDARQAWGHVVDTARRVPALGASLGGVLASVVLESVGVPTVLVHVYGGERQGRRKTLRTAVAAGGDPSVLVEPWRRAPMPVVRRLQVAGVLPVAFEGSSGGPSGAVLRGVLGGAVVAPGGRETGRPRTRWALTVLSVGTDRVEAPSSLGGSVFQSTAPSSSVVDPAHDVAVGHYGWPFVWWARSDMLAELVGEHARAVEVLGEGPWERTGAVAAMGLGLNALGRLVGRGRSLEADVTDLGRGLSRAGG